jgi:CMP-N,N'-diacetyllegionaminic acid synthase
MPRIVAVIPARGGSKGIPRKNLVPVCGKPLLVWSVEQAVRVSAIESVWVTSDSEEILRAGSAAGARPIRRPDEISGDTASSESAWLHALDTIEASGPPVDLVVGLQPTSPIRQPGDLPGALAQFEAERLDSLFSSCTIEDFFIWERLGDGVMEGVNHDWRVRKRRQQIARRYLENGSFYVFRPSLLRKTGNRLGGRIGTYTMARHTMIQIDAAEDITLCESIMRGYGMAS